MKDQTNTGSSGISRRTLLTGAAAAVAVPVAASLASCSQGAQEEDLAVSQQVDAEDISPLIVDSSNLVTLSDFEQLEDSAATMQAEYSLASGSQVFCSSGTSAIVLACGQSASPLSTVSVLNLQNGELAPVMENAIQGGFDIYDVAASRQAIAWSEYNMLSGDWVLYAASLAGSTMGQVYQLDQGDFDWDAPQFVVDAQEVVWTMMPAEDGEHSSESSYVKRASASASKIEDIYVSPGRLSAAPEISDGLLTICPRVDTTGVYFDLLAFDADTLKESARLTLPRSVRPMNAVFQQGRFAFCIEATYDSASAIAQMGSYYAIDDENWMRVARTPACTPAWCNGKLIIKNGKGTAVIDLDSKSYYQIAAPGYSWDYGDYLAMSGTSENVVTYSTVDPSQDVSQASVTVRVFEV